MMENFPPYSSASKVTSDVKGEKASIASSSIPTNDNVISNIIAPQLQSQPKPGILIVTLYEGVGFSIPDQYKQAFNSHQQNSLLQGKKLRFEDRITPSLFRYTGSTRPQTSGDGLNTIPTNRGQYLPYALLEFDRSQVLANSYSGSPENPLWAGHNTSYKFDVSRATKLTVHIYLRNLNVTPDSERSQDIFLGVTRVNPRFEESHKCVVDPKFSKIEKEKAAIEFNQKNKTPCKSSGEWLDVQYGIGKIRIGIEYVENMSWSLKIENFEPLKVIGNVCPGTVMQVRKKDTQRTYAFKVIRKADIIFPSELAHTLAERSVLSQINNPFIVPLKFIVLSSTKLYLVLPFVNGGALLHHLQKEQRFDINRSKFYMAELLCVLECLHDFNVTSNNLKPETILLDYSGHIALCNFGLCNLKKDEEDCTNSSCGTSEYSAPELLLGHGYTKTADWWTLGVLLYEMLTGLPPFYDESNDEMHRKILPEPLRFPGPDIIPPSAKDILTKLLNRNPEQRLGANGASEIKAHSFFHGIDWCKLLQREYEPDFKPNDYSMLPHPRVSNKLTPEAMKQQFVGGHTTDPYLHQVMEVVV